MPKRPSSAALTDSPPTRNKKRNNTIQNGKVKKKQKKAGLDGGAPPARNYVLQRNHRKSLHELYRVVPWASRADWDRVAACYAAEDFAAVVQEIQIWRERVSALPVGVEATLYLYQALAYDDPANEPISEEQARSLYSLAVIRYLNHVSHLATKEMGGSGLPMVKLASHVSVPEWIVNLRHEASHGVSLPSLEILRLAAAFIKSWLRANYWVPSVSRNETNILSGEALPVEGDVDKLYSSTCEIISAYVACRIYTSRHCVTIADSGITKLLPNKPNKIRTKAAIGELKIKILNLFITSPDLTTSALVQEMIPQPEFYNEFSTLFKNDPLAELLNIWNPLLNLIQKKGKLIPICAQLAEVHVDPNSSDNAQFFSALWLDNLLERIEVKGSDSSQVLTKRLLPVVMNTPNSHSKIFLARLLRLVESRVGTETAELLNELASIWVNDESSFKSGSRGKVERVSSKLVTVEDILHACQGSSELGSADPKTPLDIREQSHFWRNIPLGSFIQPTVNTEIL